MSIIQDEITSLMGGGDSEDWLSQLRPGSFRGVPFAVVNEEVSHGRRQAVHEYPYRDTAWIEDMGRGTRRFIIRGFLVQNSLVYGGGDVISQRQALINACEKEGSGTLIHPTLGDMTVSVPENGLRISGSAGNGRSFEFTLMVIESGLKVFAVTGNTEAGDTVDTNYLKLVSTAVASTLARIKSEIRGVTQGINTIKGTVTFWTNMVDNTISEVTNISNMLNSTFGNIRYGRFSKGKVGGSSSGINRSNGNAADVDDYLALSRQVSARSIMDRQHVLASTAELNESATPDEFIRGISGVVNAVLNSAGGVNERVAALEKLAASVSDDYQRPGSSLQIAETINALIVILCSGAMTSAAADTNPTSRNEAEQITRRVAAQLDAALILVGDRGDDEIYNSLMTVRASFLKRMQQISEGLSDLMLVNTVTPLPALTLAHRLYQDASRANELIQEASVPHPAFMPTTMKVLRQ